VTQSITITITATIVVILISALCAWFWTHNKQLIDQNALSYPDRVEAFDLDHQRTLEPERSNYLEHIYALKLKLATSTKANKKLKKQTSPIIKEVQTTTKNKKSITLLLSKMNTPDADVASKILIN